MKLPVVKNAIIFYMCNVKYLIVFSYICYTMLSIFPMTICNYKEDIEIRYIVKLVNHYLWNRGN